MAMMINQRLKENQEDEDGDIERIDLDALRTMDKKELNPLKPYNEEPVAKNDKGIMDWFNCCSVDVEEY